MIQVGDYLPEGPAGLIEDIEVHGSTGIIQNPVLGDVLTVSARCDPDSSPPGLTIIKREYGISYAFRVIRDVDDATITWPSADVMKIQIWRRPH